MHGWALFVGTHDIRNAVITDDSKPILQTDYFEHSSASGALFILVPVNDYEADVDLTQAVYLALDADTSLSHMVPFNLNAGRMAVFVYDIESDGMLASGVSYPAVTHRELVFTNETNQGCKLLWVIYIAIEWFLTT